MPCSDSRSRESDERNAKSRIAFLELLAYIFKSFNVYPEYHDLSHEKFLCRVGRRLRKDHEGSYEPLITLGVPDFACKHFLELFYIPHESDENERIESTLRRIHGWMDEVIKPNGYFRPTHSKEMFIQQFETLSKDADHMELIMENPLWKQAFEPPQKVYMELGGPTFELVEVDVKKRKDVIKETPVTRNIASTLAEFIMMHGFKIRSHTSDADQVIGLHFTSPVIAAELEKLIPGWTASLDCFQFFDGKQSSHDNPKSLTTDTLCLCVRGDSACVFRYIGGYQVGSQS